MAKRKFHTLPLVSLGAEHLVMGLSIGRYVVADKAPPGNGGYDIICIHLDPSYSPTAGQREVVRVEVKSHRASDGDGGFPVKRKALDAFDFAMVALLDIGNYGRRRDGSAHSRAPEFFTLPKNFVNEHYEPKSVWGEKVSVRGLEDEIEPYKNERGIEQIAQLLGVPKPTRSAACGPDSVDDDDEKR